MPDIEFDSPGPAPAGIAWANAFASVVNKTADAGLEAYRYSLAYKAARKLKNADILNNLLHREDARSGSVEAVRAKASLTGIAVAVVGGIGLFAITRPRPAAAPSYTLYAGRRQLGAG